MNMRVANIEDFDAIFHLLEASFPTDEYRNREGQMSLFLDPRYRPYLFENEAGNPVGLITLWNLGDITFIEHLAVDPQHRNRGIGGEILRRIFSTETGPFCLEAEPPETELATRRIGFYQRNGLYLNEYPYVQPAFSSAQNPVPLKIMTTEGPVNEEVFLQIKRVLYAEVYRLDV